MDDIGRLLRDTREKLGLTLEEAERTTRIRTRYLRAMEEGEFDSLPSPVQARGFLANYAEFLGLNEDEILLEYAEELRGRRGRQRGSGVPTAARSSVTVRRKGPSWLSSDLLIAAALVTAVLAVLIWGGSRVFAALGEERAESTEEGLAFLELSTPTVTLTASPARTEPPGPVAVSEASPTQEGTLPPDLVGTESFTGGVNLRILVEKRSWLRVSVDGSEVFSGRLAPGDIQEFAGAEQVELVTGNGGGLRVVFNGEDQGRLGEVGEVVTQIWTRTGAITPTPVPSETPTPTPEVSATPTATETLIP